MTKRPDDDLVLLAGVIARSGAVAPVGDWHVWNSASTDSELIGRTHD